MHPNEEQQNFQGSGEQYRVLSMYLLLNLYGATGTIFVANRIANNIIHGS